MPGNLITGVAGANDARVAERRHGFYRWHAAASLALTFA